MGVFVNNTYLMEESCANFESKRDCMTFITAGYSFGEDTMNGTNSTYAATIIAEENSEVLIASRELFEEIIDECNKENKKMVIGFIRDIWPFKGLQQQVLDKMGECFDLITMDADVELFTQHKSAKDIYILIEGECKEILYFYDKQQKNENHDHELYCTQLPSPRQHVICNSSGIVISNIDEKRLLGAFETLKQVPCKTSIITTQICRVLKARLDKFIHHIESCDV